jgi:Ca2+-binding EF-hand superfamily protein
MLVASKDENQTHKPKNMKTKAILITLALASQAVVYAQNDNGPQDQPPRMRPPMRPSPIVEALDTDHDGIISAAEIAAAPDSLKKLDKNGDGQLTPDEYHGAPPPDGPQRRPKPVNGNQKVAAGGQNQNEGDRPKPPLPPIVAALDTDKDGTISASEIAAAATSLLKLDKNGDGQLGPREYNPPPPKRDGGLPEELKPYDKNGDGKLDESERSAVKADIDSGKLQLPPPPPGGGPGGPDGEGPDGPPQE